MSAARRDLWEVSPIAQRSASTKLDLPQPLGPTTPVSPGSIMKSVGSTNDLNPCRRRRVSFISDARLAGRESLKRHNTIDGVVMLARVADPRLLAPDNGEAGRRGQPAAKAFPESFAGVRQSLFWPSFRGAPLGANPESRAVQGAGFRVC